MIIKRISVKNVRSHVDKTIDLSSSTTVLVGKNGAGKTSLLEAVYIALQGTSFKGVDGDILQRGAPWYRIDLLFNDATTRSVTFDPSKTSGKKKFVVHEKTSYRLSPKDKYPVVLFEPEDLRLLHGSPSRRRLFIDRFISQINPTYQTTLRKYERALKQRNTLLKNENVSNEDLFVWNVALSEYGAKIIEERVFAVERINKNLNEFYRDISQTEDTITAHYTHTLIDYSAQKLLHELEQKFPYDKAVHHTSVGPHRHDVEFLFNNSPAPLTASRGEARSVILALKKIETILIYQLTEKKPIVLFDDVFSELDQDRQKNLLFSDTQILLTSASVSKDILINTIEIV